MHSINCHMTFTCSLSAAWRPNLGWHWTSKTVTNMYYHLSLEWEHLISIDTHTSATTLRYNEVLSHVSPRQILTFVPNRPPKIIHYYANFWILLDQSPKILELWTTKMFFNPKSQNPFFWLDHSRSTFSSKYIRIYTSPAIYYRSMNLTTVSVSL